VKLFSFWRSLATFRVRIALNLKGITPEEVIDIDLMKGKQREAKYRAVNPQMVLPALVDGEGPVLFQSLAIIEYLDETHPQPPLLPQGARARARVRGLAQIVACDSHPLLVPRVREYLEHELKLDEPTRLKWVQTTSTGVGQLVRTLGLQNSDILITTARGVHAGPLAEFVIMALLDPLLTFIAAVVQFSQSSGNVTRPA